MPTIPPPHANNAILASLSADEYALIAPHLTERQFEIGIQLQEMDDEVHEIYFLHSGMISMVTVLEDGSAIEGATVGQEGATNPLAATQPDYRAEARSIVQIDCTASRIDASTLRSLAPQLPGLQSALQRYHGNLLGQAMQSSACNAAHATQQRMARWLLLVSDRAGDNHFYLTQEFLAQMLGLWRPTISTAAAELQRGGYVTYRRGNIEIVNRDGLEGLACECYSVVRTRHDRYLASLAAH